MFICKPELMHLAKYFRYYNISGLMVDIGNTTINKKIFGFKELAV